MGPDEEATLPLAEPERLAALREPAFRRFLASRFCAATGMTGLRAAIAWHVFDLSGSPFELGLLGAVQFLPALGLSLVGGAFADAHDRRRIAQLAQLVMFVGRGAARQRVRHRRRERCVAVCGGLRVGARGRLRKSRARGSAPARGFARTLRERGADPLDRSGARVHDGARARGSRDRRIWRRGGVRRRGGALGDVRRGPGHRSAAPARGRAARA